MLHKCPRGARGDEVITYAERASPAPRFSAAISQSAGMTVSCAAVFVLLLAAADLTSAAMTINCTVLPERFECVLTKVYTPVGATVGVTLALVAVIFIVGVLSMVIPRRRRAPVSNDPAAEAERGK